MSDTLDILTDAIRTELEESIRLLDDDADPRVVANILMMTLEELMREAAS